jgi:hypothetical protein
MADLNIEMACSGTGRGVLCHFVDHGHDLAVDFGDLGFGSLGQFSLGAGEDTAQVTAVGDRLFQRRLGVRAGQGEEFLRILPRTALRRAWLSSSDDLAAFRFRSTSFSMPSKVLLASWLNNAICASALALAAAENCSV